MKNEAFHHGNLRAALMAEARGVLAETGRSDVSLRDLARRVGVSPMATYRHFADKDALLAAVAEGGFAELADALEAVGAAAAPACVLAMGRAYVAFARAEPALYHLMFAERFGQAPADQPNAGRAFGQLQSAIVACNPAADAAATIRLWSVVHGYCSLLLAGRLVAGSMTVEFLDDVLAPVIQTLQRG